MYKICVRKSKNGKTYYSVYDEHGRLILLTKQASEIDKYKRKWFDSLFYYDILTKIK